MGFLLINKPVGWTSHDVVARLRTISGERTIGHAGTLDPFATGLLIVGVGRNATRQLDTFKKLQKTYEVLIHFGATSDTQDITGIIQWQEANMTKERLATILPRFIGVIKQTPPMFSAKKIHGKKLYELARGGRTVARKPVQITITEIEILNCAFGHATLRVVCGAGTYIRTLAHDIGAMMNVGAFAETLTRTAIGPYRLSDALPIKEARADTFDRFFIK